LGFPLTFSPNEADSLLYFLTIFTKLGYKNCPSKYIQEQDMNEKIREALIKKMKEEPFAKKFNIRLIEVDEGYAKVQMIFTPDMENMFGMAHGGAIFSLIDGAFQIASNSYGTMAVALSMTIHYFASPEKGDTITAEAKEVNRTKKIATYDVRATNSSGKLLASSQSLAYRLEKPLTFLQTHRSVSADDPASCS
jgi:acyl-CoA thioesterase